MKHDSEDKQPIADPLPNFPEVSQSAIERDLNTEYKDLESGYFASKSYRMQQWKEYAFQPYGNEVDGASKLVDSTIFNSIEWMIPTIIQPFVETDDLIKTIPNGGDARSLITAGLLRELLTYQIKKRMNFYQYLYDTVKTFLIGGEAITKLIWIDRDTKNYEPVGRPEYVAVNPDQIRYDWTAKCFADSHVVTHEEEWTRSEIIAKMKGKPGIIEDNLKKVLEKQGRGTKTSHLRDEKVERPEYVGETSQTQSKANSLYLRREHWTTYEMDGSGTVQPIMAVFIDDILVQVIKNPYDFGRPPFAAAECVRDPMGNPASGWAANLSDIQKFRTGILRMLSDNLNSQQNGLYEVDRTHVDDIGLQLLRHAPQGSRVPIPVRKPGSINPITPAPIANHALAAWELLAVEGENRSGNTRYSQGLDSQSLNQTATGIVTITQRSQMRMWEVAKRFAETCFKPLVRMTIALNQQKLDKTDLQLQFGVDVHDDQLKQLGEMVGAKTSYQPGEWVTLNKGDIGGYFSVDLDLMVGSDKQDKINNLLSYMQYVGPYVGQAVPPEVITFVAVELAKEMGLPTITGLLKEQYVGSRGVTIPKGLFPEANAGGVQAGAPGGGAAPQGAIGGGGGTGPIPPEVAAQLGL